MTDTVDTSAERVEAVRARLASCPVDLTVDECDVAADMIEALAAQLGSARALIDTWHAADQRVFEHWLEANPDGLSFGLPSARWLSAWALETMHNLRAERDALRINHASLQKAVAAQIAVARREGAEAMRERAAELIECGCKNRHEVVMQRPNSAARWNLCEHPNCMMIKATAIRALAVEGGGDE